jgi:hypothetical protein
VRGEHPELDKQLRRINRAMEDAGELHNYNNAASSDAVGLK